MTPYRPNQLARAALLLALTLVLQSLRLVIPLPPLMSTFLIGSLVNACLLIALELTGPGSALTVAAAAPVVAFLQGLLPLPVFILPVAAANAVYIGVFAAGRRWGRPLAVGLAAAGKAAFLSVAVAWLLTLVHLPPKLAAALTFAMGWPQLVTGVIGGLLAAVVVRRITGRDRLTG